MKFSSVLLSSLYVQANSNNTKIIEAVQYYARYAALSYCKETKLTNWTCKSCAKIPDTVFVNSFNSDVTQTSGVLFRNDKNKNLIISFRGSINEVNASYNVKGWMDPLNKNATEEGNIHAGFKESFSSVYPTLKNSVEEALILYPDYKLIFTGHSSGGSLASIAAAIIRDHFLLSDENIVLITYGQPKTGDVIFTKWYNQQNFTKYRVVNKRDPIPHKKVQDILGYKHHNQEVWVQDKDKITLCANSDEEDRHCSFSMNHKDHDYNHHYECFDTVFGDTKC